MPNESVSSAARFSILKGMVIALSIAAVALALAKSNFYGFFWQKSLIYYFLESDTGWPFNYATYSRWPPTFAESNFTTLFIDLLVGLAILVSVFVLMKQICQDWPRLNLRVLFVLTTMLVFLIWLAKFERPIHEILQNETGLDVHWGASSRNPLISIPLLFGCAALCYCVCLVIYHGAWFHYHAILALVTANANATEQMTSADCTSRGDGSS